MLLYLKPFVLCINLILSAAYHGAESSKAAAKSFKTPRRLYNLSDSGYDSNETPAARKNPADIELTKRYLPKKLSFENHGKNGTVIDSALQ